MTDSLVLRTLHNWQMLLLDLTWSNRLLYFKFDRASSVPITSPASAELFQLLVVQGKKLRFPAADETALFGPNDDEAPNPINGAPSSSPATSSPGRAELASTSMTDAPTDVSIMELPANPSAGYTTAPTEAGPNVPAPQSHNGVLTSSLMEVRLMCALYNLRARARTAAEEQGVNVLFVALGLLNWIEPETKEVVQSPLVLAPVQLEKERGHAAYSIELLEDDLLLNPTLQSSIYSGA